MRNTSSTLVRTECIVHRLSCLVQVQQVSSNTCMQDVQVLVLVLRDSSEIRMRKRYLGRSYYLQGLIGVFRGR